MQPRILVQLGAILAAASSTAFALGGGGGGGATITVTPATNLQAAVNSGLYSEIILEPGTYNQAIDFNGDPIIVRSTDPSDPLVVAQTILDAAFLGTSVAVFDDGEGPGTQLVGLTITGGDATGASPNNRGGGIRVLDGSPTIDRCVVVGNIASDFGGGVYTSGTNGQNPAIIDCVVADNTAGEGGGLYINSSITLTGVRVTGNSATTDRGGGVRLNGGASALIDCTIEGNTAATWGGGLYYASGRVTIDRCIFEANLAQIGGGLYINVNTGPQEIANSLFLRNEATATGGGMFLRSRSDVVNCTFVGNVSPNISMVDSEAQSNPSFVIGCIGWDNDGPLTIAGNGFPTTRHSLIQGGLPGIGNIDADPLFMNAAADDYRLMPGSPAIDAGDTFATLSARPLDLPGLDRVVDDPDTADTGVVALNLTVDMGAFEFQPEPIGFDPECPADLDLSGSVDFDDLLQVIAAFGSCP